uniref:DALR anticodon-binding domain-containing protein 3 n=1 Tax=Culex pipiens TaxID=7175 RepID=A0A8D8CCJ6_CULPI
MDPLEQLEVQLRALLQEKLNSPRFSVKCLNKQLAESGDMVVKIADPAWIGEDQPEAVFLDGEDRSWSLPVARENISNLSISLFLNRPETYRTLITRWSDGTWQIAENRQNRKIHLTCDIDDGNCEQFSLTDLRVVSVRNVVKNLLILQGFQVLLEKPTEETVETLHVGLTRTGSGVNLLCGPVVTNGVTACEYIQKRANDMQLIAQHKYGLRVKDQARFQQMIASLGRSAAVVDLLESKASSPIDFRRDKNQSSKGAAFILYNFARLSVLFRTFEEKQRTGYYPELAPIETIDFGLLKEEDEWQLFWVYVAGFPAMLRQALGDGQLARLSPHVVLGFTSGLVICLSKYYRRVRILTENRDHMLPTIFARIYLLKSVYRVLSTLLDLLELEPVTQM